MKKLSAVLIIFSVMASTVCSAKKALIFGVTGQDGAYLSEFLLEKGYEVHGIKRCSSTSNTNRIDGLIKKTISYHNFFLHDGDLSDSGSIRTLIQQICPDEIYNLAAQSHVRYSFDTPEQTADINALGVLRILDAIKTLEPIKKIKFYQASSSEMFGKVQEMPQKETTPFYPRSPYGIAKLYAHWMTVNYREAYGVFACSGILFNHESPLRGEMFVTRKITLAVAKVHHGVHDVLYLGNLDALRDWGYAKDYVEAMWQILQQETPGDYVIASGETHTVREFVELAFKEIGIALRWEGKGVNEIGYDSLTGTVLVKIDAQYFRPTEVDIVLGDATKANKMFGWKSSTPLGELVKIMVREDIKRLAYDDMRMLN
jgi:GDPmannose 4,6-dehydratase